MSNNQELLNSFEAFANFGSSKTNLTGLTTIDNVKFAKLCRESKLLGKNVTTVDIDIFFKKVLPKGERRINFNQFCEALQLIAEKKYPNDSSAFDKVADIVSKSSPVDKGTKAEANGIYSKLTDTSLYTGSHKERFDDNGNGKGLEGRETISKTSQLSSIVSRTSGTAPSSKRGATKSMEKLSLNKSSTRNLAKKQTLANKPSSNETSKSTGKLTAEKKSSSSSKSSGSVYDRLTDTSKFTGSHKNRFDSSGKGRGIAGRDIGTHGSNIHSLSQILRA